MYWEDVLSSGPKLPSYIPVVSNYPQETCDTERGGSAPSLGTDGAKSDFLHQWNFLSVSLVFSLFHRRVWSNLVITAEQRDAQTCKLCWRIFRMAFPSWQHLLPHLHFMNILWCYCIAMYWISPLKASWSTPKIFWWQAHIQISGEVLLISVLILTNYQTVKHCLHVCS